MSKDKIPDLLPCPFCGGEAEIEEIKSYINEGVNFTVGCQNVICFAYQTYNEHNLRREAIEAWNIRPSIRADILEQCVEALRKIANFEHDCGCWPCRGQCASAEALKEVIYNMCDDAKEALTAYEKMEK